jgi:hypothetical protein
VIAKGITGLMSLKLDGIDKVDGRMLSSYRLPFAELAMLWLGYQPRANADSMVLMAEDHNMKTANALKIQCSIRRKMAFKRYRDRRRWWLMNHIIPQFQAAVRGHQQVH